MCLHMPCHALVTTRVPHLSLCLAQAGLQAPCDLSHHGVAPRTQRDSGQPRSCNTGPRTASGPATQTNPALQPRHTLIQLAPIVHDMQITRVTRQYPSAGQATCPEMHARLPDSQPPSIGATPAVTSYESETARTASLHASQVRATGPRTPLNVSSPAARCLCCSQC